MNEVSQARAWRSSVIEAFPNAEIDLESVQAPGPWSYSATGLGELSLHQVAAGAQHVIHRARPRFDRMVSLMVQLEGRCEILWQRSRIELGEGQLMFAEVDQHLELVADAPYKQSFVLIPAVCLGALPSGSVGHPTHAESVTDRLLFDNVANLGCAAGQLSSRQRRLAVQALLAHVRMSTPMSSGLGDGGARVRRALAFVEEHLADPELTPQRVAQAQGVSRRHLDALLNRTGATLAQTIWGRRLERAAALLHDPTWQDLSAFAIGVECGFKSGSHFSRLFREKYGAPPSRWRERPTGPNRIAGR